MFKLALLALLAVVGSPVCIRLISVLFWAGKLLELAPMFGLLLIKFNKGGGSEVGIWLPCAPLVALFCTFNLISFMAAQNCPKLSTPLCSRSTRPQIWPSSLGGIFDCMKKPRASMPVRPFFPGASRDLNCVVKARVSCGVRLKTAGLVMVGGF